MGDVLVVVLVAALFGAAGLLVAACDRIVGAIEGDVNDRR
jgi:hypothetical protein